MIKKIVAVAAVLALLLSVQVAVTPVSAAVACASNYDQIGSGSVMAVIYETANYNAGQDGAHSGGLCIKASSTGSIYIPNLKNVAYRNPLDGSLAKVCDGQLASSYGTWNDCAGSLKVAVDCHHSVLFYSSENYSGLMWSYRNTTVGNPGPWGIGWDNVMSSVKIVYSSLCK